MFYLKCLVCRSFYFVKEQKQLLKIYVLLFLLHMHYYKIENIKFYMLLKVLFMLHYIAQCALIIILQILNINHVKK